MALISVIIPVYNGEKTIYQTIESVLKQTFVDLEILVIDDGSTDSTVEIVKSILDSRLHIYSYPNAGISANRNRGLAKATGEYLSFIDADDLWVSDKLEAQLNALLKHPQAALAYSWTDYIDMNGNFLKSGRRITETGNVYSKLLMYNFLENGSNPLIRSEAFNTVGGFDESLPVAEDWDMWLRISAYYEFVLVPEVKIFYRVQANSLSTNLVQMEIDSLQVIERAFTHPKAKSLQHLKKNSLALLYKYLTFKAIENHDEKQHSLKAAQFFWNCIRYNPSVLRQRRIMLIAILKIVFPQLYYGINQLLHGKR
ncbi:glycosyltransferase [Hassallia byssoidea VB512170]|uniref:Glycosyltransferase n=1 Tax=Hassallia byssoidea VB512170 TaxID=1304833 RepID=A0A846HEG7_9CYAN|nr:glycosyltransferase [Hassalia byssoidea]NEU75358.1 glycosyltransferase [Hassalia byssoidea VB512170]